jgi:hypothetical protein
MNRLQLMAALALACSVRAQTQPETSQNPKSDQVSSSLIALFDSFDLVALGEWHNSPEDHDLRIRLIHHPDFPKRVRNIVVECGNSLYQDPLDRYIDGQDVPREEIRKVWRDTTQSPVSEGDGLACEPLLDDVRSLNRTLPPRMRIRILAGDPPIDWSKVKATEDFTPFLQRRDEFAAQRIEREILRKGQRALIVYGAGHVWRKNALNPAPNIATILDRDDPGKLFTVIRLGGLYPDTARLESLISKPERPLLIRLKGTPIGELDANEFIGRDVPVKLFPERLGIAEVADACVYSGKTPDTSVRSRESREQDAAWEAERERRRALMPRPRR